MHGKDSTHSINRSNQYIWYGFIIGLSSAQKLYKITTKLTCVITVYLPKTSKGSITGQNYSAIPLL
jgi:hypothetical protein